MRSMGTSYISPKYQKSDYKAINLTTDSSNEDFKLAVEMFKDRINGRFLKNLNERATLTEDAFSTMAIVCLLVDTLYQFKEGITSNYSNVGKQYSDFLHNEFYQLFPSVEIAKLFYRDIRCGILHSAQTRGNSQLTISANDTIMLSDGGIIVSVNLMVNELINYYQRYCNRLLEPANKTLRKNFIKKMDDICYYQEIKDIDISDLDRIESANQGNEYHVQHKSINERLEKELIVAKMKNEHLMNCLIEKDKELDNGRIANEHLMSLLTGQKEEFAEIRKENEKLMNDLYVKEKELEELNTLITALGNQLEYIERDYHHCRELIHHINYITKKLKNND